MKVEDSEREERLSDDYERNDESDKGAKKKKKDPTRHTSDVYIGEGVYTDCDNILKKFLSLKTSTFEDFVLLWKEGHYGKIFNGRDNIAELLEFSEEALAIAKSFILPPHSQIKRIGGIYLMYGLYTQQPFRGHCKFRVTPQEWSVILKFVENLKALGFIDANYIFHKMSLDGAFYTVAFSKEFGLERNYRKHHMPWPDRDQERDPCSAFSLESLMSQVYRGSLKAAADKYRSTYNSIKQKLSGSTDSTFQGIQGTEAKVEEVLLENIDQIIDRSATHPGTKKIGLGRKELKDKAFKLKANQINHGPSTSACDSIPSTSQRSDEMSNMVGESQSESDSTDSDSNFQYLMKPPSKRTLRAQRNRKDTKKKLREEAKQKKIARVAVGVSSLNSRKRITFAEIAGQKIGGMKRKVNSNTSFLLTDRVNCTESEATMEIETVSDGVVNEGEVNRTDSEVTMEIETVSCDGFGNEDLSISETVSSDGVGNEDQLISDLLLPDDPLEAKKINQEAKDTCVSHRATSNGEPKRKPLSKEKDSAKKRNKNSPTSFVSPPKSKMRKSRTSKQASDERNLSETAPGIMKKRRGGRKKTSPLASEEAKSVQNTSKKPKGGKSKTTAPATDERSVSEATKDDFKKPKGGKMKMSALRKQQKQKGQRDPSTDVE